MSHRHLTGILAVAAAEYAGDGDALILARSGDQTVTRLQAGIAQAEQSEPVIFMRVDPVTTSGPTWGVMG